MPVYLFECLSCHNSYEDLVRYDPDGVYSETNCPNCGSRDKDRMINNVRAIVFTNPRGTSKADNLDYVYRHNLEGAKQQRRDAEALSHMGSSSDIYGPEVEEDFEGKIKDIDF
jgi:putative FmdB family regulatory protein